MIDYGKELQMAYDDGYKQGRYDEMVETEMSLPKWIPCSERLPKVGDIVLGTESYGSVDTWILEESFAGKLYWTDSFEERAFDLETVIAWMPLPEPYKGGDDDDE